MNALPGMSGSPRKMSFEIDPPELIAYEVDPWDGGDRGKKGKKGKKDKKGNTKTFENPVDEVDNPVADEWPRDKQGRMVLDKRKGREMVSGIAELYTHLRKSSVKDPSVRDSYGLWMHLDDSEDEGGGSDENEEREDGDVTFDDSFTQRQQDAKKIKHALRVDNPDHMKPEQITEALKKRGLSTKGDAQKQKETFEAWLIKEAMRMAAVSPFVVHFNSDRTQRNLEMLVAKVNQLRHGQVQEKLKAAHADIRRLEKLHDVVAKQQGTILDRDATIRSLQARIAELEAVSGGGGGSRGTIAAFSKDVRFGGSGARPAPWTLSEVMDTKAMAQSCIVLVIDSTSGFEWSQQFRAKKARTKDGRQCTIIHTAWHLINVSSTSHFGGCAVVDVLLGSTGVTRVIPDVVLVRDPCKSVHGEDHTHQLHALLHSGTPCINSAAALLACSDRPNVYAALLAIRNKQGMNKRGEFNFPLVQQEFFANEAPNGIAPSFPVVAKLSSVHAGFGKFRCADANLFNELVRTCTPTALHFLAVVTIFHAETPQLTIISLCSATHVPHRRLAWSRFLLTTIRQKSIFRA